MLSHAPRNSEQGFTLIELSIVLVIIGLVVGGVLMGQEMIRAAEVRAQITQIEKYHQAVNTFRQKYDQNIPGDMPDWIAQQFGLLTWNYNYNGTAGSAGCRDGNGLLSSPASATHMGEPAFFWLDLAAAKLLPDGPSYSICSPNCGVSVTLSNAQLSTCLPKAALAADYMYVFGTGGSNWLQVSAITNFTGADSDMHTNTDIPVIQAYGIDAKIDDGIPTKGNVQTMYCCANTRAITTSPNAASDTTSTCYNTTGPAYSISAAANKGRGANCALSFRFQ